MTITASNGLRERLRAIQEQKRSLREEQAEARRARDQARDRFAEGSGPPDRTNPDFLSAQAAVERLNDVDRRMEQLRSAELDVLTVLGEQQYGGWGEDHESFLNDPETMRDLSVMAHSSAPIGKVNLGLAVSRSQIAARIGSALDSPSMLAAVDDSGAPSLRRGTDRGIMPQLLPPLSFLDLIPTTPMDSNTVPYVVETYSEAVTGSGATETAEGAIKPELGVTYDDAEAKAATIAGWVKLKKQQLADVGELERRVRDRLTRAVLKRLEFAVIAGSGSGENLRGILNTTGVGSVAFDAGELDADQVLEGITEALIVGARPNVVALNPRDWKSMLVEKATGSGDYFSGGPFIAAAQRLWSIAAVPANGVPEGSALVGDTTVGASVGVREGVNVVISDSDSDDFTRNRVTALGEMRAAVLVWQPSAFVVVHLAA